MQKQYKQAIFRIISIVLSILVSLQTQYSSAFPGADHSAAAVPTVKSGGQNSFDNPSIEVKFRRHLGKITLERKSKILTAGDFASIDTWKYVATLCTDPSHNGCNNQDAYADDKATTNMIKQVCTTYLPQCPSGQTAQCNKDNPVCCDTANNCASIPTCANDNTVCENGNVICRQNAIGICAYHSSMAGWWKFALMILSVASLFMPPPFDALGLTGAVVGVAEGVHFWNMARNNVQWVKDNMSSANCTKPEKGFNLIDCYPVVPAPLPPPFGKPPFGPEPVDVYKTCSIDDLSSDNGLPKHVLSSYMDKAENGCIGKEVNGATVSSFYNQNIWIKYRNYAPPDNAPTRKVYAINSPSTNPQYPIQWKHGYNDAKVYNNLEDEKHPSPILINPQLNKDLESTYAEFINGKFDPATGNFISNPTSVTFPSGRIDPTTNQPGTRTFRLGMPKTTSDQTDPDTPTADKDILSSQVCVQECVKKGGCTDDDGWQNIENWCITRPNPRIRVSFCNASKKHSLNEAPCMSVSIDEEAQYKINPTYDNGGYINVTDDKYNNPPSTSNPLKLLGIFSDACYISTSTYLNSLDENSTISRSYSTLDYTSGNLQCQDPNQVTVSPTPLNTIYFSRSIKDSKAIVTKGATKFCLTHSYPLSPPPDWCTASNEFNPPGNAQLDCNVVCAQSGNIPHDTPPPPATDHPQKAAKEEIYYRTDPKPAIPGQLSASDNCNSNSLSDDDRILNRMKNPIEADLCIDTYPLQFITLINNPYLQNILTQIQNYCYTPYSSDDSDSSTPKHYQNFDECMRLFQHCATHSDFPSDLKASKDLILAFQGKKAPCNDLVSLFAPYPVDITDQSLSSLYNDVLSCVQPSSSKIAHMCVVMFGHCRNGKASDVITTPSGKTASCGQLTKIWPIYSQPIN